MELKRYNKLKAELLHKKEVALLKSAGELQTKLLNLIYEDFISKLDIEDGFVKNTKRNRDRIQALNKLFDQFQRGEFAEVIKTMILDYKDIHELNAQYYASIAGKKIEDINVKVKDKLKVNLGIEGNKLAPNGFLDSFVKDPTLLNKLKQLTYTSITSNTVTLKQYSDSIKKLVTGSKKVEGAFTRHFKTFATDTFAMYDRVTNTEFADQLGMDYALYQGGIIESSRPFCIARNNKVFTRDEISKFGTNKDKYGGYEDKKTGEFQGKPPSYDPFRDCGGYNCRHTLNFITKSLAERMRPDLKKT